MSLFSRELHKRGDIYTVQDEYGHTYRGEFDGTGEGGGFILSFSFVEKSKRLWSSVSFTADQVTHVERDGKIIRTTDQTLTK